MTPLTERAAGHLETKMGLCFNSDGWVRNLPKRFTFDRMSEFFQFRQFRVRHDRCGMKVGTDAVLLGAWVSIRGARTILDIGAGSGVISLMLAQRTGAGTKIDAVEWSKEDAAQAIENILASPWPEKIKVYHTAIQDFISDRKYDLVVTNPPYFSKGLRPSSASRAQARHTTSLTPDVILAEAKRLLNDNGVLATILPFADGKSFKTLAGQNQLQCSRALSFFSRPGKPQERWLFEFSSEHRILASETLVLHSDRGRDMTVPSANDWSEDYKKLTEEFYLGEMPGKAVDVSSMLA